MAATSSDEAYCPRHASGNAGSALLQAALRRENLQQAFKRVRANKGAAGVDGRDIDATSRYLAAAWPEIREQLLAGTYRPSPVRNLAQFFDRVNHDILIDRLQKRIDDTGVIRLIRAHLNSGIMDHGVAQSRHEGTQQGGPLSPLLANVLLETAVAGGAIQTGC